VSLLDYTIAICTYNRSAIARLALESIVRHAPAGRRIPVILVDNNSSDDTPAMGESFRDRLNIDVYIEKTIGLSHARNRAMNECRTEYIIYIDDDAKVTPRWFDAIEEGIKRHGKPDFFGGPYGPYYLQPKPHWFKDRYGSDCLNQKEGELQVGEHVTGGNMGWRLETLRAAGGFPTDLGMTGNKLAFGEETAVQHKVLTEFPGSRGIFLPEMWIEHLVPPTKMTLGYWIRRFWGLGRDDSRSFPGRYPLDLRTFAYEIALLGFLPIYYLFRPRDRYPYWQNLFFEVGLWRIRFWGRVYTRLFGR
jgi:glycosyltransferase involved in cell wall biosynthesis